MDFCALVYKNPVETAVGSFGFVFRSPKSFVHPVMLMAPIKPIRMKIFLFIFIIIDGYNL